MCKITMYLYNIILVYSIKSVFYNDSPETYVINTVYTYTHCDGVPTTVREPVRLGRDMYACSSSGVYISYDRLCPYVLAVTV